MMISDLWPGMPTDAQRLARMLERELPPQQRCGRAEGCEYCYRVGGSGELCESRMESGELVDATFICNACLEEIERDIRNEQLLDCGGSA